MGLLSQAAAYLSGLATTLQAQGARLPPGLLVCRAAMADLEARLHGYASGQRLALGSGLGAAAASAVSSVGRWLDASISKLMGGESD